MVALRRRRANNGGRGMALEHGGEVYRELLIKKNAHQPEAQPARSQERRPPGRASRMGTALPPYPELDGIREAYIEGDEGTADIVARGFDEATVKRVIAMVDKNEFKRRQGPIGIKTTCGPFGKD